MSDSVIQTMIIMGSILVAAWTLRGFLQRQMDGRNDLERTKRKIEAARLEAEAKAVDVSKRLN